MGMAKGIVLFFVAFFFFAVFSTSNKNLKTQMRSVKTSRPSKDKNRDKKLMLLLSRSDSQMILLLSGPADRNKQSKLSMSTRIKPVIPAWRNDTASIFITAWNPNVSSWKGDQCRIRFLDRGFFMKYISKLKKYF